MVDKSIVEVETMGGNTVGVVLSVAEVGNATGPAARGGASKRSGQI